MGLASKATLDLYQLEKPVFLAEIYMSALVKAGPPASKVVLPPLFPAIDRDNSFVVDETVSWYQLSTAILDLRESATDDLQVQFERVDFIGAFRGTQIGEGKKSVTVRFRYRSPNRTLTHTEIDAPVQSLLGRLRERIAFEIRT
jgi:phenylalanyl-tRNA synthetase beta chain